MVCTELCVVCTELCVVCTELCVVCTELCVVCRVHTCHYVQCGLEVVLCALPRAQC